jgi:hypothetical protein
LLGQATVSAEQTTALAQLREIDQEYVTRTQAVAREAEDSSYRLNIVRTD